MGKKVKTEEVIDQATAAALFFRRLIDEGVPTQAAIQMAAKYVEAQVISDMLDEAPTQPWEEPGK